MGGPKDWPVIVVHKGIIKNILKLMYVQYQLVCKREELLLILDSIESF